MEATKQLLEAGVSPGLVDQIAGHAAAMKGTVQDALGGTDTPKGAARSRPGCPALSRPRLAA